MDRVHGVGGAVGETAVGDVHGVLAPLRDFRPPGGGRPAVRVLAGDGFRHPGCSRRERVLIHAVYGLSIRESGLRLAPGAGFLVPAGAAHLPGAVSAEGRVVVADDLPVLDVPLARSHHNGTSVLEHRDEEGEDITLRIKVFHGAEGGGPLPFPALRLGFVIASVALPEGDVTAGKAPAPLLVGAHQRDLGARIARPEGGRCRPARVRQLGHRQGGEVVLVGINVSHRIGAVGGRNLFPQLVPEPFHVIGPPGIVPEFLAEVEVQRGPPFHHLVHLEGRVHGSPPMETGLQGVGGGLEILGGLGREGEPGQQKERG